MGQSDKATKGAEEIVSFFGKKHGVEIENYVEKLIGKSLGGIKIFSFTAEASGKTLKGSYKADADGLLSMTCAINPPECGEDNIIH